jgi:lipid II:glycine glycyltransferase (peptidoglycan interpeptide bridge formation enzyme)
MGLLYMPRGPVLDWSQAEQVEQFAGALRQVACEQGAFLVQADPAVPEERGDVHAALTRMGFQRVEKQGLFRILQPVHVMRIPVERYGGPEGLLAALPHKSRYNIGLAKRKGVVIVPRTDRDALRIFHQLLLHGGRRKGFPVRSFRFHEAVWRHCVQTGLGEYLFAEHGGRVLGVIQVLRFGPTAWYMYGASTGEDQHLMASYLLQWAGISRSWAAGCRCYDMRGVVSAKPSPEDPEYGVYEFKRRFNAELVSFLGEYDLVISPRVYTSWRWLERAVQRPAAWSFRLYQKLGDTRETV